MSYDGIFLGTLLGLIGLTFLIQIISKMKIVDGNELGIVSGRMTDPKGFRTISGGWVFKYLTKNFPGLIPAGL